MSYEVEYNFSRITLNGVVSGKMKRILALVKYSCC